MNQYSNRIIIMIAINFCSARMHSRSLPAASYRMCSNGLHIIAIIQKHRAAVLWECHISKTNVLLIQNLATAKLTTSHRQYSLAVLEELSLWGNTMEATKPCARTIYDEVMVSATFLIEVYYVTAVCQVSTVL